MTFKNAIILLGKIILAIVLLYTAIGSSTCAFTVGGVFIPAGILNLAVWVCGFVWYYKHYLHNPKTLD